MQYAKLTASMILLWVLMFLIFAGPFFTIWTLNQMFQLKIEYTFKNWAAVVWLITLLHGIRFQVKKS